MIDVRQEARRGSTWLRLVSLRLRHRDELLERGKVKAPLARFLCSLRA